MQIAVTGGAGFIGSHIVDALIERGHSVLVVDDFSSGKESNLSSATKLAGGRLQVLRADVCDQKLHAELKAFQPETVFHLAAQMNVRRSMSEPAFDAEKNVVGTVNVLEAARAAGVKKVIFSSTGGALYGEQEVFPAPEEHVIAPESAYGVSKRAGELYLEYFARVYGLACVSLRFANVYGPRQNPKGEAGVVAIFTERLFAGEPLRVNGDGLQTRDFVYVGDVVRANMLSLEKSLSGFHAFNIGRGVETSVLDVVSAFQELVEKKHLLGDLVKAINVTHGPALPGEQRRSVIDASKIRCELGWEWKVELLDGISDTLISFSKRA